MGKFKYIVGECKSGEEAVIRFFSEIDEWSAHCFISEFLYLESLKPCKIKVLINSEGGSVMYGMSMFSVISNSSVDTECIIEGIAASMGSIVWAAGKRSLMRDYGILMIHTPFVKPEGDEEDKCKPKCKCDPKGKCKPKCKEDLEEEEEDDDDMEDGSGKCKPKCKCDPKDKCDPEDKCDPQNACDPKDKCDPKDACKKPKCAKDEEEEDVVKAFRQQIEMIYQKRFGLSKKKVQEIMDGGKGKDGTFFTAQQAVEAGIIPAENVIKTTKQKLEMVKNAVAGLSDAKTIRMSINPICDELCLEGENKHFEDIHSNLNKTNFTQPNTETMNENKTIDFNYGAVVASLGLKGEVEVAGVMSRIQELVKTEGLLKEANETINTLKTEKAGEEAKNANLSKQLKEVQDALDVYKKAEQEAREAKIMEMVENAIKSGRIGEDAKESWVSMAQANFELAEKTLNSIPAREKLSDVINNDPKNVENSQKGTLAEVQAKIEAVVGKDFAYHKFE